MFIITGICFCTGYFILPKAPIVTAAIALEKLESNCNWINP